MKNIEMTAIIASAIMIAVVDPQGEMKTARGLGEIVTIQPMIETFLEVVEEMMIEKEDLQAQL